MDFLWRRVTLGKLGEEVGDWRSCIVRKGFEVELRKVIRRGRTGL